MTNHRCWLVSATLVNAMFTALMLMAHPVLGQEADDEDQPPGLRARYQAGTSIVERVDADIAFVWGDAAPDERLPPGKFQAAWSGTLLLRGEERYRFHAFIQGRVKLVVNGRAVLEGSTEQPQWISGPETPLTFGDQPFELAFERTGDAARLKLYWSSDDFPLEPVPYHVLFQKQPANDLTLIERGRIQFASFRCGNCHAGSERGTTARDAGLPAPALDHVGVGTRRDWLIKKLTQSGDVDKHPRAAGDRMPHFGFSADDAAAIVAALLATATPIELSPTLKLKAAEHDKDVQAGATLIRSVGCLACHTWNSLGEPTPFGGGSLDDIAQKRSAAWLTTWLSDPAKINARHRMPIVVLTEKERAQIVLALTESAATPATPAIPEIKPPELPASDAVLARGASLLEAAGCVSCHTLPKLKAGPLPAPSSLSPLFGAKLDWNRGCLQAPDRTRNRPTFPRADAAALRAYVASWSNAGAAYALTGARSTALEGRRLLEQKNCLACHDRDATRGVAKFAAKIAQTDDALAGQQMTLIPPRLNAVGDRLHDAGLSEAIRGDQKSPRLNWLRVRMPKFAHSPTEQQTLLEHLIGHDRIPEGAPTTGDPVLAGVPDPQRLLAGRELLGGKGFSCVACHAVKDYTPKVTALGTRGSNLHLLGQRMRSEYYFRWTRAPLRVMPGVEMPNYQRPHEFILPGRLDLQLTAIWEALNYPNLTAPTNPASVEQLLAVGDHDRPRVVRDLFTIPGVVDETVARAFAIGLPGGHSVLFDLDSGSMRGWTLGDFARQRCEGKRWYWDLAGSVLATRFDPRPDIMLVHRQTHEVIAPETGWAVVCELQRDHRDETSVTLEYDVRFQKGEVTHTVGGVIDRFSSIGSNGSGGWQRRITARGPEPYWPWLRNASPSTLVAEVRITTDGVTGHKITMLPTTAVRFQPAAEGDAPAIVVKYQTLLRSLNPRSNPATPLLSRDEPITSVPGFVGRRWPLPRSIMPTALAWDSRQRLIFTSFKGHVYRWGEPSAATPSPSSAAERLTVVEEGLAAPYGIIELPQSDPRPDSAEKSVLLIAHKPELLRLSLDAEGRVRDRTVFATGWGLTDDYHDWTCGIVRDSTGNLYVGLGSDYTFKNRPVAKSRWRGDILRITPGGAIESIARGLRYPTGLAIDDRDRLFCTDQQGVQNTFNELNHIQVGHRYGVPSRHEPEPNAAADLAAVQIPHPWTRSVNGIVCVPKSQATGLAPLSGHLLAAEINNHALIRLSLQTVGDIVQGAVYPFSKPAKEGDSSNFVGPLCIGISPKGEIHVGGLQDGGWAGGLNMGEIVTLSPSGKLPNGIRELRATRQGFEIEFFHKVDPSLAVQTGQYKISGYTRVWKGDYATPDSGHHSIEIQSVTLGNDGRTVSLTAAGRKPGYVYDISVGEIGSETQQFLWPAIGHFTLYKIPD